MVVKQGNGLSNEPEEGMSVLGSLYRTMRRLVCVTR